MSHDVIRRVRPWLFTAVQHRLHSQSIQRAFCQAVTLHDRGDDRNGKTLDYQKRVRQLEASSPPSQWYPRLERPGQGCNTVKEFCDEYNGIKEGETLANTLVALTGRVKAVRSAGSKLVFVDVHQGDHSVQAVCKYGDVEKHESLERSKFKTFMTTVRRGDWYEVRGHPHRTASGELSVLVSSLPRLLSPSLHQIPQVLDDAETKARSPHADMIVNPAPIQTLRVAHLVEQHLNEFLTADGFTKIHTPILSASAGGAVARPFETEATELEGQDLQLRIAPELWLKRLVVGGMEKVYEIGPAFRNEGVDNTHNPEFHTCEFYQAFATLDDLIAKTESLLQTMSARIEEQRASLLRALPAPKLSLGTPFLRLEFLPTLERALGQALPDLTESNAASSLCSIFDKRQLALPAKPTLPRLLDALASHFIEPLCVEPTFITHHPACLSPLAKHVTCPSTGQRVAIRAELFISHREYANMYEEENSPFEQRCKFVEQLAYREIDGESDGRGAVDEGYLEVLEWGLPPTGGWGCGIDRLVMFFSGQQRIADVLPFGTLRNVVALGKK